jgi:hypothetical protein
VARGAPMSETVLGIMAKPEFSQRDLTYLSCPETDAGRAAGREHFDHVNEVVPLRLPIEAAKTWEGRLRRVWISGGGAARPGKLSRARFRPCLPSGHRPLSVGRPDAPRPWG